MVVVKPLQWFEDLGTWDLKSALKIFALRLHKHSRRYLKYIKREIWTQFRFEAWWLHPTQHSIYATPLNQYHVLLFSSTGDKMKDEMLTQYVGSSAGTNAAIVKRFFLNAIHQWPNENLQQPQAIASAVMQAPRGLWLGSTMPRCQFLKLVPLHKNFKFICCYFKLICMTTAALSHTL